MINTKQYKTELQELFGVSVADTIMPTIVTDNEIYEKLASEYNEKLQNKLTNIRLDEDEREAIANHNIEREEITLGLKNETVLRKQEEHRKRDEIQSEIDSIVLFGEHEAVDLVKRENTHISLDDALDSIRSIKAMITDGADKSEIIRALLISIATVSIAYKINISDQKLKSGNLFPDWTADGWKLVLCPKPKKEFKNKYKSFGNFDINTPIKTSDSDTDALNADELNLYVYAYAYQTNSKGVDIARKSIYLGKRDKIKKLAENGVEIIAHNLIGAGVDMTALESKTLAWREKQAKKRNGTII